eukprot:5578497-Pyramimonas_sp.AAC.1
MPSVTRVLNSTSWSGSSFAKLSLIFSGSMKRSLLAHDQPPSLLLMALISDPRQVQQPTKRGGGAGGVGGGGG